MWIKNLFELLKLFSKLFTVFALDTNINNINVPCMYILKHFMILVLMTLKENLELRICSVKRKMLP